MPWTAADLSTALATARAAYLDAMKAASLSSDGASINRQRLDSLRKEIEYLENELDKVSNSRKTYVRTRVMM